ncbi:MAG: VWA domain-containing protein [Pyrinomonadaceae bacterium]
MRRSLLVLMLFLSCGVFFCVYGQDKKPGETDEVIKVETQLVDVPIAVTNSAGVPLRALKASNFVLYEDGKPQEISDFSTTSEPFEVALLLDTSGSTRNDLQLIQRAAADFIASLRPGDRVSVIAFNTDRKSGTAFSTVEVLSRLTDDRSALKTAVERVRTSNGTPYYDSLLQVAEKIFAQRPTEAFRGRRALVALTDGVDSTSAFDFALAKEELNDLGVISFFIKVDTREFFEQNLLGDCEQAIRFSSEQIRRYYRSISSKPGMEKAVNFCQLGDFERLAISKKLYELAETEMNDLAKTSGGKVFPVGDLSEARNAFKRVAEEIGTKYTLGYYPSNDKKDGTYRKIRVEVKGLPSGTQVRSREGYTAPSN